VFNAIKAGTVIARFCVPGVILPAGVKTMGIV